MSDKKYVIKSDLDGYVLNCFYWNGVWQAPMSSCPLGAREYTRDEGIKVIKTLETMFLGLTFTLEEV